METATEPVIGFGKHKGKKFSELPTSYIHWVEDKIKNRTPEDRAFPQENLLLIEIEKHNNFQREMVGCCSCEKDRRCEQIDPRDWYEL